MTTPVPSTSQTSAPTLGLSKDDRKETASRPELIPASSIARAKTSSVASSVTSPLVIMFSATGAVKHSTAEVATISATAASGDTGIVGGICSDLKVRSWFFSGRIARILRLRACAAPLGLQPASALVPTTTTTKSKPQSTPLPEVQAAAVAQQTESQAATPAIAQSPQETDSTPASGVAQADSQAATPATPAESQDTQQADSQAADNAEQVDSQAAASPAVAAAATTAPVIVQGQTVPANGSPITVNSKAIRLSSGSIYVDSSAAPIPQAQVSQSNIQPIVAGTFTLHPAAANAVAQATPSSVVVGDLTFSAPQSEPSVESNTEAYQAQAQPVVVGGKTYALAVPTSQSENLQAAGSTPEEGVSEPSISQEQSGDAINNDHTEPDESTPQAAQADSTPIVIGGMTYTPVPASPTSLLQSAAVFSFGGTALTQGGKAVMVSGTLMSLGISAFVVGTSSIPLSTPASTTSLLAIGSQTLTALAGSEGGFEIDHSTLLPGSSGIAISGTTYSINGADSLVVGTSTIALATVGSSDKSNSVLTAGGETFTPLGSTAVVVDGTTLSIGGSAITENGTRVSLASNGLLVGSSTFAYATPVVNSATVSTTSGTTLSTGILPSTGAASTAIPSATGGVRTGSEAKKGASAKMTAPRVVEVWLVVSMSLIMIIGTL